MHALTRAYLDAPRTMPTPHLPSSPRASITGYSASLSSEYDASGHERPERLRFPTFEKKLELFAESSSRKVLSDVFASVEKNILLNKKDGNMTCYRRNYIAVQCHYELSNFIANEKLYVSHPKRGNRTVQAFGVQVSATIDDPHGKAVGLIQHTPKRDAGPKVPPEITPLGPSTTNHGRATIGSHPIPATNGPNLPLQGLGQQRNTFSTSHHTFERIQFQQATANNGRRRAQQQYYYLIVELHADIRSPNQAQPDWVLVAQRISDPLVVRGRSPGHYKDTSVDGPSAASGGSQGGRPVLGGPGFTTASRSSSIGVPYALSGSNGMSSGGSVFHGQSYVHPSPTPSQSGSLASSYSGTGEHDSECARKRESPAYGYHYRSSAEPAGNYPESCSFLHGASDHQLSPAGYGIGNLPMKAEHSGVPSTSSDWQAGTCSGFSNIGNAGFAINAGY